MSKYAKTTKVSIVKSKADIKKVLICTKCHLQNIPNFVDTNDVTCIYCGNKCKWEGYR